MKRISMCIGLGLLVSLPGAAMAVDKIAVDELEVVTPEVAAEDMPMGQGKTDEGSLLPEDAVTADQGIFGAQGGYIHPYLRLEESYTDNVFNSDSDEVDSLITKISPGIWVTLPRKNEIPVSLSANNTSPGGVAQQIAEYESMDKVQLYALAGADLYMYSDDSSYNTEDYFLEGMGRYNMASGLSLQLLERFTKGHDIFQSGTGATSENIRVYTSNLIMATADWDITEKVRIKTDLSNFDLSYDDSINSFLERRDNIFDLYTYYKYTVKTAFFLQYRHADIEYDSETENDNSQNSYYAGINYKTTEKLSLMFKAGIQDKQFDTEAAGHDDSSNPSLDMQAAYKITEKTQVTFDLFRNTEETDSSDASEREVLGAQLGYEQQITDKITGRVDLRYENADYTQLAADSDREDDVYAFSPAVQYLFRDWLMAEAGYSFEKTDSSDDFFDYETNIFFVSLNFAL